MSSELHLPLSRQVTQTRTTTVNKRDVCLFLQRNDNEMRAVRRHWNELGQICGGETFPLSLSMLNRVRRFRFPFEDLTRFRPIYSAKDFLEVLTLLINPNVRIDETLWKCVPLVFLSSFLSIFMPF